jgi:hypothetical protein
MWTRMIACCFSSKEDNSEEPEVENLQSAKEFSSNHLIKSMEDANPPESSGVGGVRSRSEILSPREVSSPHTTLRRRYKSKNISISASLGDYYMTN